MNEFEVVRFLIGAAILAYAAYSDVKHREARDILWVAMGAIGVVLLVVERPDTTTTLVSMAISFPFAFLLYIVGMGGADVKALWAITLLIPLPPHSMPFFPPLIFVFPLVVLLNSLILIVFLPPIYLIYNAYRRDCEFPYCLFGYRMKANLAKHKFVWSMEKEGKKRIMPFKDCDMETMGEREIWVTPQLPFLVFIFAGFVLSFLFGDILFFVFSLFLK